MSDSVAQIKSHENQKGEGGKFIIYIGLDRGGRELERMAEQDRSMPS